MEIGYAALDGDKVIGWSLEMHDDYVHEFDNLDWLNGQWSGTLDDLRYENGKVYDLRQRERGGLSDIDIVRMLVDSVTVPQKPAEKIGFITVPIYDHVGNSIVWTFEPDPNYLPENDGSDYLKPKRYVDGMTVTAGLWYTDGTDIWECIKSGTPSGFTDTEYFDIIQ